MFYFTGMDDKPMNPVSQAENNFTAWSQSNIVEYYAKERRNVGDLYDSERALLMPALKNCASILDFGCAAGGFLSLLQTLNRRIRYVGLDVSPEMIRKARSFYPSVQFEVNDGSHLPFPDGSFDLAVCTGVLNHNPNYQRIVQELYRVAAKGCVLDLPRLVSVPYQYELSTSHMVLKKRFPTADPIHEGQTVVPYVLSNPQAIFEFLHNGLEPRPRTLVAIGYYGKPPESAILPVKSVCYCVVYLGKGDTPSGKTDTLMDLPNDILAQVHLDNVEYPKGKTVGDLLSIKDME